MTIARTLPHSIEAEEMILSACMLDGGHVIQRCLDEGIGPENFYETKHALVFCAISDLHNDGKPVDAAVVAQEMKRRKELDQIGGIPFITQVSGLAPTTASAGYHIERVREMSAQRELIRIHERAIERAYNSSSIECLDMVEAQLTSLRHRAVASSIKSFADMELPPEDGPNELLGHNRYLGRGDSCLIVSSSGMGKSSLSMIWVAHIALGLDFLGIPTKRPSKSVIFQAEDSDGDMGELWFSVKTAMKLTDEQIAVVRKNVIVIRDKVNRGAAFISSMRSIIAKEKPDFVWINPLHAYAGCEITDATQIGQFLREGLNKANREESYCYMIVHHTPKPMTGKAVADKKWHEFMYDAAGSAELVNWTRAVITLKPTDVEGEFHLVLAKRGKRAGVMQETQGEGSNFLQPTTKIAIKQSGETIQLPGRKRPFHLLNWEKRVAVLEPVEEPKTKKGNASTFKPTYTLDEVTSYFPENASEGEGLSAIQRFCHEGIAISKSSFLRLRGELMAEGLIEQLPDKRYRRTARGDAKAEPFQQKTP